MRDKIENHLADAQRRASRRKSLWNFILIPLCGSSVFLIVFGLLKLVWFFHVQFYPQHEFKDFWQAGISFESFVPSFLMCFAPIPGAFGAGCFLGNFLAWLIPSARRTFDREAQGYPGTTFKKSMKGLFLFTVLTLPTGLAVALVAAYFLKSLK